MIGTLQLARALTDHDLSEQLLNRGVETAMNLLEERAPLNELDSPTATPGR